MSIKTNAKTLCLHCIDFRFMEHFNTILSKELYMDHDKIILGGSSLHINCDHNDCIFTNTFTDYFTKHVKIAHSLHNIKEILILEHENCLAYKNTYGLEYDKNNIEYHKNNLIRLKKFINENEFLSRFVYKYYFVKLDGSFIVL
jgi:hypothetical protein